MERPQTRPSPGTTTLAAGAALVLALGAVGCGGGSDDDEPTTNTAAAASGDQGAGSSTAPVTNADPAAAPAEQPKAIASRPGEIGGEAVTAELVSLKRSGPTLILSLRLRPTKTGGEARAQIAGELSDGVFEKDPDGETIDSGDLDGITLVDKVNRKRHLVARDAKNGCVCSTALSSVFVRDVAPTNLSATFGAPPADVRTMDVTIPKFGTFTDVPVS